MATHAAIIVFHGIFSDAAAFESRVDVVSELLVTAVTVTVDFTITISDEEAEDLVRESIVM